MTYEMITCPGCLRWGSVVSKKTSKTISAFLFNMWCQILPQVPSPATLCETCAALVSLPCGLPGPPFNMYKRRLIGIVLLTADNDMCVNTLESAK